MMFRCLLSLCFLSISYLSFGQTQKTDLLILGSDHLTQLYNNEFVNTDVLSPQGQEAVQRFTSNYKAYHPDVVMVEVLPQHQYEIDSLYLLYLKNDLNLSSLPDGRSEVYQIAFRIAKQSNVQKIYCVNAPGGTSQSILDNGQHIELYKNYGAEVRSLAVEKITQLKNGTLSLNDYLSFLNQPKIAKMLHQLRYVLPARVINGTFKNPDPMVDIAFINPKYIGAELTSIFKNRDYKIYANMVTVQMDSPPKRILLVIGVAHIGSLKSIFRDDDAYNIVDADRYLKN